MTLDLGRIQALCFDVDGTLRDTDDQWVGWLSEALHPLQRLTPQRDYRRLARRMIMSVDDPANFALHVGDRLGLDNLAARLLAWRIAAVQARTTPAAEATPIPAREPRTPPPMIAGVLPMLQRLHGRFPLAVVSARGRGGTLRFLDAHALTPLFKVIVTGQTCRFTKPFPDPVEYAARAMGVPPEACLMIGDTIVDILAGKAAGAQTVGVLCGFGQEAELRRRGADLILSSTAQLADTLLGDPAG